MSQKKILRRAFASGLNVVPQGGKRPIVEWGKWRDKRIPEKLFEKWLNKYGENNDWAVVCGEVSGVVVLDVDDPDALKHDLQPFVHTPSGGYHVWVRHPGFECRNGVLKPGVELKWSITATFLGRGRELDPERRIVPWAEIPADLRRLVDSRRETQYHVELPEEFTDYVPESELLEEALERVGEGSDGGRNNTGLWLAAQLRDELQGKPNADEIAWKIMRRYARKVNVNGAEPYTEREAYDTLQSAFTRPPRTPRSLRDPSIFNREFKRQEAYEKVREYRRALKLGPFEIETFPGVQEGLTELEYVVDKLQVDGSSILISGKRKQGKTTVALNLARSLIDGNLLFGRFPVRQVEGTVAYWNYEMSLRQFNVWLNQTDIEDDLRFVHWPLRGKHVNLMNDDVFKYCVEKLKEDETEYLFMDPWSRAIAGIAGENSNEEVRAYLERVDELKERAGIPNLAILAHISAKSKDDMVRGASALEDWADAWWTVTKDSVSATGRDIDDVQPFTFSYDKTHKRFQYETTMDEAEVEWSIQKALEVLKVTGEKLTTRQWETLIRKEGVGGRVASRVIQACRDRDLVRWEQQGKQRIIHWTKK